MKKNLFLLVILLSFSVKAQKQELGKVTIAELEEKQHPMDSSAAASILFKKSKVNFTINNDGYWNVVTEVEVKIKIYKKEGYKYSNFEKAFYTGVNSDKLYFSDVATYNLVDGKVEKTKLKSDGQFLEKKNANYSAKKISLPNVKEGSIIEYKYEITTYGTAELDEFYFQYDIPVKYVEYKTSIPEYFIYNKTLNGYLTLDQKEENVTDYRGSYNESRTTFSLANVPSMKDEDFVNNIDNYRSHITFELSSKSNRSGLVEKFATDWESVTKKIYDNDDFGRQLDKDSYFEDDLEVLTKNIMTNDEKISTIFNFVKSRMSWNEYNGYNCNDGVRSAYKNKVGNVAEINLILIAMLRKAGIDANPIILSTRSNGIKIFPSRTAFNYVIAGVELENRVVLLDATDKNAMPDILPRRDLNWFGRIIRKNESSAQLDLDPKNISKDLFYILAEIDSEGKINGKVKHQAFDYNAYNFRNNHISLTNESHIERLEKRFVGNEITEFDIQNLKDLTKPIIESYTFNNDNSVEIIGDKMYFSPLLFYTMSENPFKQEIREYPVDFVYPNQDRYTINFKIPDGFEVESLPKQVYLVMGDKLASFKYNITNTGQQIQVLVVFDINQSIISPDDYTTLKDFFKTIIEKQTEKIVLKKT